MRQWGLTPAAQLERVVVVSPHLDDAVLGCGRFLSAHPGGTVLTVFAGNPPAYPDPMRLWDVQSGFVPGDDVMVARRREDDAALALLGATPVHLEFVEHTFNPGDRPVAPEVIAAALAPALAALNPTLVLAPFGLANPDHDVTHRACMLVREQMTERAWWCYEESQHPEAPTWWLYEDHGYKHIPGMLAWRISSLFRSGVWPTPVVSSVTAEDERSKQAAVQCYPTQLLALEDDWQISAKLGAPEQYWSLDAPPAGWEGLAES
jgi:LmbE family N-acetylglucosaminyl deacetylase